MPDIGQNLSSSDFDLPPDPRPERGASVAAFLIVWTVVIAATIRLAPLVRRLLALEEANLWPWAAAACGLYVLMLIFARPHTVAGWTTFVCTFFPVVALPAVAMGWSHGGGHPPLSALVYIPACITFVVTVPVSAVVAGIAALCRERPSFLVLHGITMTVLAPYAVVCAEFGTTSS